MEHDHKRQLRQLKREIKRAGNKRLRRQLRREVVENPEDAHFAEVSFGRLSSAGLNGLDRKTTPE
jgi:hypothetical protein